MKIKTVERMAALGIIDSNMYCFLYSFLPNKKALTIALIPNNTARERTVKDKAKFSFK